MLSVSVTAAALAYSAETPTIESASEAMSTNSPCNSDSTAILSLALETADVSLALAKSSTLSEEAEAESNSSSSTGKREEANPMGAFDILHFKNSFMEMVEELQLRRAMDTDNKKQIEELVASKHELAQKLSESILSCQSLTESHMSQIQEIARKHEDQLLHHKNEQAKSKLLHESREKELKALKDEMRTLHLAKHVLEKKVQEQDRCFHLQNSSRETYLNKMTQLEEKCSSLFKLAEEASEQITTLATNVKQATVLHHKLEYVNKHQSCELDRVREKLEKCRQELIESRAHKLEESRKDSGTSVSAKGKATAAEQDLKLERELCKDLELQLSSLREQHRMVLSQLKEAHLLLKRHTECSQRAVESEGELKKKLEESEGEVEILTDKLLATQYEHESLEKKFALAQETWNKKIHDTEHRLAILQSDYKQLQDSHEWLEASKLALKREYDLKVEDLTTKCTRLKEEEELCKDNYESRVNELGRQLEKLQSALDQSELQLAMSEKKLKERETLLLRLEEENKYFRGDQDMSTTCTAFSPEVITGLINDETLLLVQEEETFPLITFKREHTSETIVVDPEDLPSVAKKPRLGFGGKKSSLEGATSPKAMEEMMTGVEESASPKAMEPNLEEMIKESSSPKAMKLNLEEMIKESASPKAMEPNIEGFVSPEEKETDQKGPEPGSTYRNTKKPSPEESASPYPEGSSSPKAKKPHPEGPSSPEAEGSSGAEAKKPHSEGSFCPKAEGSSSAKAKKPYPEGFSSPKTHPDGSLSPKARKFCLEGSSSPEAEGSSSAEAEKPCPEGSSSPKAKKTRPEGPKAEGSPNAEAEEPCPEGSSSPKAKKPHPEGPEAHPEGSSSPDKLYSAKKQDSEVMKLTSSVAEKENPEAQLKEKTTSPESNGSESARIANMEGPDSSGSPDVTSTATRPAPDVAPYLSVTVPKIEKGDTPGGVVLLQATRRGGDENKRAEVQEGDNEGILSQEEDTEESEEEELYLTFSPDTGVGETIVSTQVHRQIERVEKFLKMDRLRKTK